MRVCASRSIFGMRAGFWPSIIRKAWIFLPPIGGVAVPDLRASIFELIDKPSSAEIAGVSAGLPPGQIQITNRPSRLHK